MKKSLSIKFYTDNYYKFTKILFKIVSNLNKNFNNYINRKISVQHNINGSNIIHNTYNICDKDKVSFFIYTIFGDFSSLFLVIYKKDTPSFFEYMNINSKRFIEAVIEKDITANNNTILSISYKYRTDFDITGPTDNKKYSIVNNIVYKISGIKKK